MHSGDITFTVTCPHCGRKLKVEKCTNFSDYRDNWDRILSDFNTEEFLCPCGERFLGAETAESGKVSKVVNLAKKLKAEGKFDLSENGVKIKLGFSDIWSIIRELKSGD